MKFNFEGTLPASKSLMNRALICQSYGHDLKIEGLTEAEDVLNLKSALQDLHKNSEIRCGDGGTTIRFMALRTSRVTGTHVLTGTQRLMSRPMQEIQQILNAFQVECEISPDQIRVDSAGWKQPQGIVEIPMDRSTQFASALLINCWALPFDLHIRPLTTEKSIGYWKLTLALAQKLGMRIEEIGDSLFFIPKMQKPLPQTYLCETDLSSAFTVAAAAALFGKAKIQSFPNQSLQPDLAFVEILKAMGVDVSESPHQLTIKRANKLLPIQWNISACPDLFPVLAVLCTQTQGVSILRGAPHLKFKESNRISKIEELLQKAGIQCVASDDGLQISGNLASHKRPFKFDPDYDHRIAMAAGLLKMLGFPIEIVNPRVVNKSFPGFWELLES